MAEKRFAFRKELTTSNVPFKYQLRNIQENEISMLNGAVIVGATSPVIEHAKTDFKDYLKVCFGVRENSENPVEIKVEITHDGLEDVCDYKGRVVEICDKGVLIRAYDDRGAAQAIYDLEDVMTSKKQPYLTKGKTKQKPLFTPRMAHSAYDLDVFPDGYLQRLAKDGIDAIILFIKGANKLAMGDCDINALIDKAETYGMDVYAYCYCSVFYSPEAPDAEEVFDNAFGKVFKAHPKFKGMIFVGESVQFPRERRVERTANSLMKIIYLIQNLRRVGGRVKISPLG